MATNANAGGSAEDAEARTWTEEEAHEWRIAELARLQAEFIAKGETDAQQMRERYAEEAEQAVKMREQTIKDLQESLKAAKVEAKRLRAEADTGAE